MPVLTYLGTGASGDDGDMRGKDSEVGDAAELPMACDVLSSDIDCTDLTSSAS